MIPPARGSTGARQIIRRERRKKGFVMKVDRRAAHPATAYSFEIKPDTDRGVDQLGMYRLGRLVYAFDLPGGISEEDAVSLGDGLAMLDAKAMARGKKELYNEINTGLLDVLKQGGTPEEQLAAVMAMVAQIGRDVYDLR